MSAFDIAGYTKDRLREKLTSKLSPRTPCTVMLDTDDDWPSMRGDVSPAAMERFRAEIAEIEAKEARKNAGGGEPYDLFVESCGGHADEIARAIAAASKTLCADGVAAFEKRLDNVPFPLKGNRPGRPKQNSLPRRHGGDQKGFYVREAQTWKTAHVRSGFWARTAK